MLTQRLPSDGQKRDEYIDNLVKIIRENPNSCDEVWFSSDYGYPTLEVHKNTAETIKRQAEKFKEIGIRISMQISNTIGHGAYSQKNDCSGLIYEGSPAEHLVGEDGTVADYCFCWRGDFFKQYIVEEVKLYAQIVKPYAMWFDDDLRAWHHAPVNNGCFCDYCLSKFNVMHGSSFSREELVHELSFGDIKWRKKYTEFLRQGLYDFIYEVSKAIHELSPDTIISCQHGPLGGYHGGDLHFIFHAMKDATGKNPGSRPGGGTYDDYELNDILLKGDMIELQNRTLPDYVTEIRPEIESLPDVAFGKTIAGTCMETSYYFALGSTAMSYAILKREHEPFSWHSDMLGAFSAHRSYWERMVQVNEKTKPDGIAVVIPEQPLDIKCETEFEYDSIGMYSSREGGWRYVNVPMTYDRGGEVFLLSFDFARHLSDDEIKELMKKPVLTDAKSMKLFAEKGFRFSGEVYPADTSKVVEMYEKHPVNRGFEGGTWSGGFLANHNYYIKDINGKTEALSRYTSIHQDAEGLGEIANGIVTTEFGGKWAVFAFDAWNKIISTQKRDQILNVIEYLSGKNLNARMITPIKAVVLPRIYRDGTLACVSILNASVGGGSAKIKLNIPPKSEVAYMAQYYPETKLVADENSVVTIPYIAPWSVGTMFV